ncbi:MAG TPA: non-ribosomal peptide synthetase [Bryobacteraceae bacterium]|jgi:amino acid adenylation domain-containing protein
MIKSPLIHQLFGRQALRTPAGIALKFGNASVTYAELNMRTNQVAQRLRRLGIGPEMFVGVLLERSVEAVVGLLGILKAGGAYVYLDPNLPQPRLEYFLSDSRPRLIITNGELRHRAGDQCPCLDIDSPELASESPAEIPCGITPDNAAYVLYTSGSTGEPKGALEIHRCLTARLSSGELPDIRPDDVCALNSSLGFGITASRLFLPLALGATVAILSEAEVQDPRLLLAAIESQGITSMFLPPPILRTVVDLMAGPSERFAHLRSVTTTGSMLTDELSQSFFRAFPFTQLVNVYGSTEIGTTACLRVMDRTTDSSERSIGRPVAGTKIYLLDENRIPIPAGACGEIYVSAPHMAREYLNKPELTARSFVTAPCAPQGRLYRTGDLGRALPDGEIGFLGRTDHQVKIHGFRVELGEIEAALERHDQVQEAVVMARAGGEGDHRLTAYFVTREGGAVPGHELRNHLRGSLPAHMVPSMFVRLAAMPRTISGKVDRPALPECGPSRPDLDSPYEPPRNATESALAGIWSTVLRVRDVGIHDNFFELGGDSLAATQVIVLVQQNFKQNLTLDSLFELTIAGIAARFVEL